MEDPLPQLLGRLDALMDRLDHLMAAPTPQPPEWQYAAYQWRHEDGKHSLVPVHHPHKVELSDLLCIDWQKDEVLRNTRQFMRGMPANNVLLWGSRGNGKSTLIKAVFNAFKGDGLRLIEVQKEDLIELPRLTDMLYNRPERFILYCDDLSFDANDPGYKPLKAALEGSIAAPPDNMLIYASSNRRHLLPEYESENQQARVIDNELHLGESLEEKISLSERFGLWLPFHPFNQEQYLRVVDHWLKHRAMPGVDYDQTRSAALQWATQRGGRSGRTAYQFVIDWIGRQQNQSSWR